MIGIKALYTQVALVCFLWILSPSSANSQTYGCAEDSYNFYLCMDGQHSDWDAWNPYSSSFFPVNMGSLYEIWGTAISEFHCRPVESPTDGSRRVVLGSIKLEHKRSLIPFVPYKHSTYIECRSPPPPPPPPPPMIVFNESPTNLEFMLCMMAVRPGAPRVTIGTFQAGEAGDTCALDPGSGVDEKKGLPNDL